MSMERGATEASYWRLAVQKRLATIITTSSGDQGTLKVLDNELAALRLAISAVYWQRYNMAPVSRLPHDVLAYIFSILSIIDPPAGRPMPCTRLGWIKVVHVCSHWRQVVFESSRLLSHVVFDEKYSIWKLVELPRRNLPLLPPQGACNGRRSISMKMAITDPSAFHHWNHTLQNKFGAVLASSASNAFGVKVFDDELAIFRAAVPVVCAQRNSLLSISRLPAELLANIFSLVLVEDPTRNSRLPLTYANFGWIKVSHVCSRWRQVALETPMLWAHVVFDLGLQWTLASLERAKHAPLIIQYQGHMSMNDRLMPVDLVVPHLFHTKTINLSGDYRTISGAIQSLVYPAPILERIDISIHFPFDIPHLPVDLFAHHAPNLRVASFDGLINPWSSLALPGLTSLSVSLLHIPPFDFGSALPSQDELFEALSGMPLLECLSIIKILPLPDPRSKHTIVLPRLSRLELEGKWLSCMALLAGIRFPGTAQLLLTCVSRTNRDPPVDVLLSVLERQAKWLEDTSPLDCMSIQMGRFLRVIGWSRSYSPEQSVPSRLERALELKFSKLPFWTMVSIIRAIHIHDLVVLRLRMDVSSLWDLATLRDVFRHAYRLKHVHLANFAAPMFCALLDHNPGNAATQAQDQIALFPDLQSIRLKYVEVDQIYTVNEPLPAVRDSLRRRLNGRQNLRGIIIEQCSVSQEWVEVLKKFVPNVVWDGKKQWENRTTEGDNW